VAALVAAGTPALAADGIVPEPGVPVLNPAIDRGTAVVTPLTPVAPAGKPLPARSIQTPRNPTRCAPATSKSR